MLELKNIVFGADDGVKSVEIIRNISLNIPDNKFIVITGPNGGGKSTLAKLIAGIEKPVSGRLIFKVPHLIDSRDPKGRMAEAGDYVIGEFVDGHLVQGIWYGADRQVKGSIIIGQ